MALTTASACSTGHPAQRPVLLNRLCRILKRGWVAKIGDLAKGLLQLIDSTPQFHIDLAD